MVKDTVCYAKAFDIYLKVAGTLKIFIQDSDVFEFEIRTCDFSCFSKVGIDFIVFFHGSIHAISYYSCNPFPKLNIIPPIKVLPPLCLSPMHTASLFLSGKKTSRSSF